jgi:hypothetical protein
MKQTVWYPLIIILLAIATCVVVLGDFSSPIRPFLVFSFLLVCPGLAFIHLLRFGNLLVEWTLAVALSIGIDTLVAEAMLYSGLWSSGRSLGAITIITLAGASLQLWQLHTAPVIANN